ncbi:hypothetical protein Leryth_016397 [Lithospermum erythrorhizon]|nr:hypothetical protein Leryth_016397 [Lithospermum erythrorhizon]
MGVDLDSVSEATSGAIGAVVSSTILYPLDTCKAKYQAELRSQNGQFKYRQQSAVSYFGLCSDRSISLIVAELREKFAESIRRLWEEALSKGQVFSLYQGLGTKNLQAFVSQFIYFYGYSYFKKLYLQRTGFKSIGTKSNLVIAAVAGACTAIITH